MIRYKVSCHQIILSCSYIESGKQNWRRNETIFAMKCMAGGQPLPYARPEHIFYIISIFKCKFYGLITLLLEIKTPEPL